ncbi:MAG: Sulfatase [Parcubacteria group bacterium GW2011_GWA1_38_7]|nr:MAG: Sulfatase [Parcubacteria group bacterium GW2011_GWA1_38_7]
MKNLILISLDTVRADVAYSGKFPNIEKLRRIGVTFLNTISSSPFTPASHATIFTGLQPYNHGIRHLFREKIKKNAKTLAEIVKEHGYKTGAIASCPGMNKWYGFSRGFDDYDDEIPKLPDGSDPLKTVDVKKRGAALKRANLVVDRAKKWLQKNQKENFFLFVHFFDAHWPYNAPEKFGGTNAYEEEIAFTDHYLGNLIDFLKKYNLFENTTIVCLSDHGEDLEGWYPNDKGGNKLGHPEESGHGCLLYDQTQKVVLIIKDNNLPKGKEISKQVRLVDVHPTILDLLDIKETNNIDGLSLAPIVNDKSTMSQLPAYSETFYPEEQTQSSGKYGFAKNKISIRSENSYKIIFNLNSSEIEIYDLNKDEYEKNNLYNGPKRQLTINE